MLIPSSQEYFGQSVGSVKKVELSYGPGGVSRGIATVIFAHADGASKAFQELNGLLIDNKPVKVEVVVSSADQIPPPKTLGQRIR
jgi:THO complex subunit 4